jgi:toxin ParE1/3/4
LAIANLESVFAYSEIQWGFDAASEYQHRLERAFQTILDHPELGTKRDDIRPGARVFTVRHHPILYRFSAMRVTVLRVIHERMNTRMETTLFGPPAS